MQKAKTHKVIRSIFSIYLIVVFLFGSFPLAALAAGPTISLTANGQSSLTLATSTDSFTISLTTTNATACQMTSPVASGIDTASTMTIAPGSSYYPAIGGSSTFSVTCTDGTDNQSASVTVSLPAPAPAPVNNLTVDIKANGSNGPVTLAAGDAYTYTWTSSNATACQMTSPVASGIDVSGTSNSLTSGSAYYPTATSSVTLTITCTDGTNNQSDSVVVSLAGGTPPAGNVVTADIKANGLDGPVQLTSGASYTYTWASTNATACQMTSPVASGIDVSGTSNTITSTSAYYPGTTTPVTLTIICTDGVSNATDSVVVGLAGGTSTPNVVTVDIKANGSDGPVTLNSGQSYVYTWSSNNATACQMTSPVASGIDVSGTSNTITSASAYYPTTVTPVVLTIICTDGVSNATDSVVVGLMVINNPGCPVSNIASLLTASAQVNQPFSYTITTTNASSSPILGVTTTTLPPGFTFSSTTGVISGTATTTGTYNISLSSTNICGSDIKVLVLTITAAPTTGGPLPTGPAPILPGGGGGGIVLAPGGSRNPVPVPATPSCLFVEDYMRQDFNNDPEQVMRLQSFMKIIQGYDYVTVNGVFDNATLQAVNAFQTQYKADILTPWGHTAPTNYVYILTLKKINEIYCLKAFPLNDAQAKEIVAFKALLEGFRNQGFPVQFTPGATVIEQVEVVGSTTTPIDLPIVGQITPQGQNLSNLASVVFAAPDNMMMALQCLYEFLLILIVLYILGNVLKDIMIKDTPENVLKKFITKWSVISIGLTAAIILAYFLGELCLILPLLIALILALFWMAAYPKHTSIRASVKSWYLVVEGRTKTIWHKISN